MRKSHIQTAEHHSHDSYLWVHGHDITRRFSCVDRMSTLPSREATLSVVTRPPNHSQILSLCTAKNNTSETPICRTASLEHCSPCQEFAPYSSRTQLDTCPPTTPIRASFNLESGHPLVPRPRAIYAHLLVAQASAPGKPLSCIAQRRGRRPQRARSQRHERTTAGNDRVLNWGRERARPATAPSQAADELHRDRLG